jgi:uncharacterized membrane protein YbhN (UPF0104 family)
VNRRAVYRVLSWLAVIAVLVFFSRALWRNWQNIRAYEWQVDTSLLVLSTVVLTSIFVVVVFNYTLILRSLGLSMTYRPLFRAFHLSNLGRYLPGKVWSLVGFVALAEKAGVSRGRTGQAVVLGTLASTAGGLIVGLGAYALWPPADIGSFRYLLPLATLLIIVSLHPAIAVRGMRLLVRVMRRNVEITPVPFARMLAVTFSFVGLWILWATGFALLVKSVADISWSESLRAIAVFPLSYLLGLFAVFSPGGLGVREGSIAVLCSGFLPTPVALSISVLSRFQIGFLELLAGVVSLIMPTRVPAARDEA